MLSVQQDPTPDLNPDTLGALSALMLAQAQEIFVHKAIHGMVYLCFCIGRIVPNFLFFVDNMKDAIIAKLAYSCDDLYGECLKIFQRENLKSLFEKEWLSIVSLLLYSV